MRERRSDLILKISNTNLFRIGWFGENLEFIKAVRIFMRKKGDLHKILLEKGDCNEKFI